MNSHEPEHVVLDTSVLINFLAVDRMDLLSRHPGYRFLVTEHVRGEVTAHYGEQVERLDAALATNALEETRVEAVEELALFAQLTQNRRLGLGECAAIAAAVHRGHVLAIDDKVARRAALALSQSLSVIDTQAAMVSLIRAGVLSVEDADAIKTDWETNHSFALKLRSFEDIV